MDELGFDLVVIGTGSGLDVATALAREGWRVAIVEKAEPGGTCLVRGCIPSKMLLHSADLAEAIRGARRFGIDATIERIDFEAIMRRVREHVDGESRRIEEALRRSEDPRFFAGEGRFVGEKRLLVGDAILSAPKFLLATGARPRVPDIPGLADAGYLTSTDALSRPRLPRSIVILGGGYIASEIGHFYGALGTDVTILQKHDVLLARDDREVSERFTRAFARKHRVILQADAKRVSRAGARVRVEVETAAGERHVIEAEEILVAVGLTRNADTLDLDRTGVRTDERGRILVDHHLETDAPGIFALGDAVGRHDLKHAANHEAQYVHHNLRSSTPVEVNYQAMPRAVFSSPQVAAVGATEEQLVESGVPYLVGRHEYHATGMGKALDERDGFVKVLSDPDGVILGCHILGPDAPTLIHEVVLAMTYGMRAEDVARTIHIHPALPEVVQRAAGAMRGPDE